jgi:hypothetical protein
MIFNAEFVRKYLTKYLFIVMGIEALLSVVSALKIKSDSKYCPNRCSGE